MRFDEDFLRRLEALRVAVRRAIRGRREGERDAPRKGGASVFHSYRPYAPGDDFRSIDWCLYARLGTLFVRERTREEAPRLQLVVDTSPSMEFGTPSKADLARKLAAVVGFLTLGEGGEVTLRSGREARAFEGDPAIPGFLAAVESVASDASPVEALRAVRGRPVVVVISDLWDEGMKDAFDSIAGSGAPLSLIQVLAREELSPAVVGVARLVDRETGEAVARYVGEEERVEYANRLEEWFAEWRAWASRREATYARCVSDEPFDRLVMTYLRGEGVIE